jgi:hypothetical protein
MGTHRNMTMVLRVANDDDYNSFVAGVKVYICFEVLLLFAAVMSSAE